VNKLKIILGAALGILSAANIYVFHTLVVKSLAIGDTKAGNYGDPVRALQIENEAGIFQILAALFLGLCFGISLKTHMIFRILISIFVAIAIFFLLFIFMF